MLRPLTAVLERILLNLTEQSPCVSRSTAYQYLDSRCFIIPTINLQSLYHPEETPRRVCQSPSVLG